MLRGRRLWLPPRLLRSDKIANEKFNEQPAKNLDAGYNENSNENFDEKSGNMSRADPLRTRG